MDKFLTRLVYDWRMYHGYTYEVSGRVLNTTTMTVFNQEKARRGTPYSRMQFIIEKIGYRWEYVMEVADAYAHGEEYPTDMNAWQNYLVWCEDRGIYGEISEE